MHRHPHILNASTNLLGICFVLITGLKLTGTNSLSRGDEVAWFAALCFLVSTVLSYGGIRAVNPAGWYATWADFAFMAGVVALFAAVLLIAAAVAPL